MFGASSGMPLASRATEQSRRATPASPRLEHMQKHDRCPWFLAALPVAAAILFGCQESSITTGPAPAKCSLALTTRSIMDATGGTSTFTISTEPECTWSAASATDWIVELSPTSGQGSATVQFRVAPNQGSSPREGDILVESERLRVSQRAPCRFDLAPSSHTLSAAGGTGTVTVAASSECAWTATTTVNWIALIEPISGSGNGTVGFSVAVNTGAERSGVVIIGGQQSRLTQAGSTSAPGPTPGCSYSIAPGNQNISAAGGTGTPVAVSTSNECQWGATSNASWIAITSGTSGSGNGAVAISIAGNTGSARTGTLTIAGQSATVTQDACSYAIAPTTQNIGGAGGSATPVSVTTLNSCQWTARSNTAWISVTSGAAGSGNGSVGISVTANPGSARTGSLTIAGRTSTIEQSAGCEYRISPTDQTFGAGGGSGVIDVIVASGCQWAAQSNASWIAVQSGLNGAGSARVEYSVDANSGGSRTGAITIAGQTFTVTQRAAGQ